LSEVGALVPRTLWKKEEVGSNRSSKNELRELFPDAESFDTPKPTRLIERMLRLATGTTDENLVLDFFAGSGTTAHAVLKLNQEDNGKRKFILVQLPEPTGRENYKTIADIAKERIRRAGAKIKADAAITAPDLDIGFRVLKIDTSNMKDVYYTPDESKQHALLAQVDNIKADRSPEDLLFQVLVDWGVDLAKPIAQEALAERTVFFVDGNGLAACFDQNISDDLVKEIAKRKPLRAVFCDSSYGSDSVKINVEQIFKLLSPSTEIRSI
jgi:adenine-specific DNA-methyltransferase